MFSDAQLVHPGREMNPKELKQMVCRNEVIQSHPQTTGRYQTAWCDWSGWVKKPKPNPKQRVMPEKGWGNAQDTQT